MADENTTIDSSNSDEVQGNTNENQGDFQETEEGRTDNETVEIVEEVSNNEIQQNQNEQEQLKKVLMTYIDKLIEEKLNTVKVEEPENEEVEEVEEETLFKSFDKEDKF